MKRGLSGILQGAFIAALLALVVGMAITAHENLSRQGVATGFSFLFSSTGWDVSQSFLPHEPSDPYWWTFVIGLVNTLLLSVICIILATVGGAILALLGAGRSRILQGLTRGYVWLFRNVPLIVQVFFWYHVTRQLPAVRDAHEILGCCYASNRGIYIPQLSAEMGTETALIGLTGAALGFICAKFWNQRRNRRGIAPLKQVLVGAFCALCGLLAAIVFTPVAVTVPRLQGFNFVDGTQVSPEFMALAVAIVVYNIAFVAEILNSGIRAVPQRQLEAARVIGLSAPLIFWRIALPQAVRIAVPPLVNQYISLTKSSSLAIAIGYSDLFSVGVIAINHTGQSINVIAVLMLAYLCVSFGISALGNAYNRSLITRDRR